MNVKNYYAEKLLKTIFEMSNSVQELIKIDYYLRSKTLEKLVVRSGHIWQQRIQPIIRVLGLPQRHWTANFWWSMLVEWKTILIDRLQRSEKPTCDPFLINFKQCYSLLFVRFISLNTFFILSIWNTLLLTSCCYDHWCHQKISDIN